jgi:uncharacterized repeat protein (TIGR01451 family)
LSILITAWPEPVGTGSLLTYTLRLSNLGPSTAHDVTVKDTLPVGVNFVSAIGNGWTCADDAGLVTCHSIDLAAGSLTLLKIQVNAPSALGNLVNSVEAATTAIDPVLSNNSAEVNSKVLSFAYLPVIHR